ncbi:MAG TPA: hypothetical protein VF723_06235, partial [Pyrinomonadaceae bacterium]
YNADPDEFIKAEGAEEYERRRGEMILSPAEFIKLKGIEDYKKQRGAAVSYIKFILSEAMRDRNLHQPADKAAAVEEVLPYIRAVRNGIQKREYFDMAMNELLIEEPTLRRELWQLLKPGAADAGPDVRQKIVRAAGAQPTIAEQRLLELLFADEDLRRTILPQLTAADYEHLPTASIFRVLMEIQESGEPFAYETLTAKTADDPVASDLIPLLLMSETERAEGEALDDTLKVAESCLDALRLMAVNRRIDELRVEMAAAERGGESERHNRLALEHLELARRKKQILEAIGQMSVANI